MGLSFNIHVQPGLKFHSEVVLPDNVRSSHRFTRASPKASKRAGGCLMKVLQLIDAGNLCVSGGGINRALFVLFPELEDLVGNFVVGFFAIGFFEKLFLESLQSFICLLYTSDAADE